MIQRRSSQKRPFSRVAWNSVCSPGKIPPERRSTMAGFCSLWSVPEGRRETTSAGAQAVIDSIRASVRREVLQRRTILICGSIRRTRLETFANAAKVRMKKSSAWTLIASRWLCCPLLWWLQGSVVASPPVTLATADAPPGCRLRSDAPLADSSR